jgi:prepilin-type processing-associated H-X9-DG protein
LEYGSENDGRFPDPHGGNMWCGHGRYDHFCVNEGVQSMLFALQLGGDWNVFACPSDSGGFPLNAGWHWSVESRRQERIWEPLPTTTNTTPCSVCGAVFPWPVGRASYTCPGVRWRLPGLQMNKTHNPASRLTWLGDHAICNGRDYYGNPSSYAATKGEEFAPWHRPGEPYANMVFLDGHVAGYLVESGTSGTEDYVLHRRYSGWEW